MAETLAALGNQGIVFGPRSNEDEEERERRRRLLLLAQLGQGDPREPQPAPASQPLVPLGGNTIRGA